MNGFIPNAWAEGAAGAAGNAAPQGSPYGTLIMLAVLFALFYFLLIRPQAKRAKEHKAMVADLSKGDEVVTNGGTLGKVTDLGDSFLTLEVASGVHIKVQRHAIQTVMPKGTLKSA